MPLRVFRAYGLAVVAALSSVAVSRLAWPWLAPTPFLLGFAAVAAATHWGSPGAGVLAIALTAAGAFLAFPTSGAEPWHPASAAVFVLAAFIGNGVIANRDRTARILREREAQLRATLDDVRASADKLRHAQKMQAVGQLMAGVAHNFDNNLMVVMGYIHLLLEEAPTRTCSARRWRRSARRRRRRGADAAADGVRPPARPATGRVHVDRVIQGAREMLPARRSGGHHAHLRSCLNTTVLWMRTISSRSC